MRIFSVRNRASKLKRTLSHLNLHDQSQTRYVLLRLEQSSLATSCLHLFTDKMETSLLQQVQGLHLFPITCKAFILKHIFCSCFIFQKYIYYQNKKYIYNTILTINEKGHQFQANIRCCRRSCDVSRNSRTSYFSLKTSLFFWNIYQKFMIYFGHNIFSNIITTTCENSIFTSAKIKAKSEHLYKNRNI